MSPARLWHCLSLACPTRQENSEVLANTSLMLRPPLLIPFLPQRRFSGCPAETRKTNRSFPYLINSRLHPIHLQNQRLHRVRLGPRRALSRQTPTPSRQKDRDDLLLLVFYSDAILKPHAHVYCCRLRQLLLNLQSHPLQLLPLMGALHCSETTQASLLIQMAHHQFCNHHVDSGCEIGLQP